MTSARQRAMKNFEGDEDAEFAHLTKWYEKLNSFIYRLLITEATKAF